MYQDHKILISFFSLTASDAEVYEFCTQHKRIEQQQHRSQGKSDQEKAQYSSGRRRRIYT